MKKSRLLVVIIFSLLLLTLFMPIRSVSIETDFDIEVYVDEAYYADLEEDNDNYEDDVYVLLRFELSGSPTYDFEYDIRLTLPSGQYYEYDVFVSVINKNTLYMHNYFWDHATESGNYTVDVSVFQVIPEPAHTETTHTFDPPGGSGNSDPSFGVS